MHQLLEYIPRMQQLECQLLTEIADLRLGAASQGSGLSDLLKQSQQKLQ